MPERGTGNQPAAIDGPDAAPDAAADAAPDAALEASPPPAAAAPFGPGTAGAGPHPEARFASRRRQEGPRRIRNGLKLRQRQDDTSSLAATRWRTALEHAIPVLARAEGLEYARVGQVISIFVLPPEGSGDGAPGTDAVPARIEAMVQGRSARPYAATIEVPAWTRRRWDDAIEAMAREAIYAARIVSGDLPAAVDDLCAALGAALLPAESDHFNYRCSCSEPIPCKHHAAAVLLLADRLVEQPLLAFNLRGMPHESVLHRLQEARTLETHGQSTAHSGAGGGRVPVRPFEACLADFWRPGPQLAEFEALGGAEHVPHAILRRLGPPLLQGKFPLVGLLASIYDSVRSEAIRLQARPDAAGRAATDGGDGDESGDGDEGSEADASDGPE